MTRPIPSCVDPTQATFRQRLNNAEFDLAQKLMREAGFSTDCPCIQHEGLGKLMSSDATAGELAEAEALDCIWSFQRLIQHYLISGLGARDLDNPWEDFTAPDHEETIGLYAANLDDLVTDGVGLVLLGRMGTGKTSAATYLVRQAVNLWGSKLVTFTSFQKAISGYKDERLATRMEASRLLVIDEIQIGISPAQTELFDNRMSEIVVSRYQQSKATIITANHTPQELEAAYPRMMSRLGEMNETLTYVGTNHRRGNSTAIASRLAVSA